MADTWQQYYDHREKHLKAKREFADRQRQWRDTQRQIDCLTAQIRAAMEHQARMTWLLIGAAGKCN